MGIEMGTALLSGGVPAAEGDVWRVLMNAAGNGGAPAPNRAPTKNEMIVYNAIKAGGMTVPDFNNPATAKAILDSVLRGKNLESPSIPTKWLPVDQYGWSTADDGSLVNIWSQYTAPKGTVISPTFQGTPPPENENNNFFAKIFRGASAALGDKTMQVIIPLAAIAVMGAAGASAIGAAGAAGAGAGTAGAAGAYTFGGAATPFVADTSLALGAAGAAGAAGASAIGAAGAAGAGAGTAGAAGAGAAGAGSTGIGKSLLAQGIIGTVGSLGSAYIGSEAARRAGNVQADAAQNATNAQLEMYYQSRDDLKDYREVGGKAVRELEKQVMAGPGEFVPAEQPGYKFGYKEFVEKPLLQNASATGKLRSGNILRSLSDRASDYASLSYDNWLNRWLTKLQPMQSLAGVGQTSASTTAGFGVQTGQGMAQNILAGGQAQAGGAINRANALTGGIQGVSSSLMDMLIMNKVLGGNLFGNAPGSGDPYGGVTG